MQDVEYFQKKVYRALNVPLSRLDSSTGFQLGKAAEISRDEVKFAKFIHRIRLRFSHLFDALLHKQLILKKIINADEWKPIKEGIKIDFTTDNHYAELKDTEMLKSRLELLQTIDPYANKYFSVEWIRQNVLRQTAQEREEIDAQIKKESTVDSATNQNAVNNQLPDLVAAENQKSETDTGIDDVSDLEVYDPLANLDS